MNPLNSEQTQTQKTVSQQQPVGSIDITGQDNANAQVNAAGNATVDQSRHIIYNYYYQYYSQPDYGQQDVGLVAVMGESASDDVLICPYRGLFHFGPDDADVFFGREIFVSELEQAVQSRNFVAVLGASGSGKSSVVLAGLVPELRQSGHWQFSHFRPGDDPFQALALALVPLYAPEQDATDQIAQARKLAAYLQSGDVKLDDAIARIQQNHPNQRVLLIADQFEELYTLCPQEETRRQFLDCLLASLANDTTQKSPKALPLVLVTTMRADFLGNGLSYRPFADMLQLGDVKLGAMNPTELTAVIEQPAAQLGVTFEAGLVQRILRDVENEPGNLPLLEFALTELWKRCDNRVLTHTAYEEIGQVDGALARYADEQYALLNEDEKAQVKRIFVQLVRPGEGSEDTRRLATKAELGDGRWPLVKQLADSRLVVTSQNERRQETVEVVHEALIRNWEELRGWMRTDRAFRAWQERLRGALQQWEATERDEGALLRGAALAEAKERWKTRRGDLGDVEGAFIQASMALQRRERAQQKQQLRKAQRNAVVSGTIALLAVIAGGFAWKQQQRAEAGEINSKFVTDSLLMKSDVATGLEKEAITLALQTGQALNSRVARKLQPYTRSRSISAMQSVMFGIQPRGQQTLIGHRRQVLDVSYSPDGNTIATASVDKTVKLWNTDGTLRTTLEGHSDVVLSVSYSPDGDTIATGGGIEDKTVKLWNADGTLRTTLEGHKAGVLSVSYSPDGNTIASGGGTGDHTVKLWNADGTLRNTLEGHSAAIWSVSYSPDGNTIASAGDDKIVRLWNANGTLRTTLPAERDANEGHSAAIWSVVYSPDGNTIATASDDHTVKLWNVDGTLRTTLEGHTDGVRSVAYSQDGNTIATAGDDHTVKLWNADGTLRTTLPTVKLRNADGTLRTALSGHNNSVWSVVYSPDGSTIATASDDNTVKLWEADGTPQNTLSGHNNSVWSVVYSPDGDTIATASDDNTAKLWETDGTLRTTLKGHSAGVKSVSYSPDGSTIATASDDNTVKLWETDGTLRTTLEGHQAGALSVSYSPDGNTIATASDDHTVKLWNADGTLLTTLEGHKAGVKSVVYSPDGSTIATGSGDKTVKLWETDGTLLTTLSGHSFGVKSVVYSPDGNTIATASDDHMVKLWNADGTLLTTLEGHKAGVLSVSYSPDGNTIATASDDHIVKLWDADGTLRTTLEGHSAGVKSVVYSPDGNTIATASDDNTVKLWEADVENLMTIACHWLKPYFIHQSPELLIDLEICQNSSLNQEVAPKLVERGVEQARDGHSEKAVALFKQALLWDSRLDFDPYLKAQALVSPE